jgi:hypothetical protein
MIVSLLCCMAGVEGNGEKNRCDPNVIAGFKRCVALCGVVFLAVNLLCASSLQYNNNNNNSLNQHTLPHLQASRGTMASATADTSSSSSSSTTNTSRMSLSLASPRAGAGSASTSLSPKGSGGGATPLSPRGAASPLSPRGAGGATGPPLTATQTQQQRRVDVLTEILQTETAYVDDLVLVTEVCAREIDLDRLSQHPTHCCGVLWCDVMWYGVVVCQSTSCHRVG